MELKDYRTECGLSFQELGDLFGWSKAKAYQYCSDSPPCMKLIDANNVVDKTAGKVCLEDLLPEDC